MAKTMTLPDGRVGDLGKCRSCNADIVWARTKTGARMPYTVVEGDLKLDAKGQPFSHFGDCPQSRDWSKQKDLAEVTPMNRAQRRAWLSGRKGERTLPKLSKMRRRG